jgi:hypothetical protein
MTSAITVMPVESTSIRSRRIGMPYALPMFAAEFV